MWPWQSPCLERPRLGVGGCQPSLYPEQRQGGLRERSGAHSPAPCSELSGALSGASFLLSFSFAWSTFYVPGTEGNWESSLQEHDI